jgi:hypothetical protein
LKKIFVIIVIVTCLLGLCANNVLAGNIYIDYQQAEWVNDTPSDKFDNDAPSATIGFTQCFNRVKFSLEYTKATWKDVFTEYYGLDSNKVNADYKGFDITFGYRLTEQITANLGYHKYDLKPVKTSRYYENISGYDDNYADIEMSGIMLGIDGDFDISDRISLNGSLEYGINSNYRYKALDIDTLGNLYMATRDYDMNILAAKIKFNYNITNSFAASIGYRYTSYDVDFGNGQKSTLTLSGPTVGFAYKFGKVAEISKLKSKQTKPTDVTLILKNELHSTEYTLLVSHSRKVRVGDTIEISAEQAAAIKNALCGPYITPSDGEIGIRPTAWCKFGKKEVILKADIKHDSFGNITKVILIVDKIK